jgi:hypothetical protein
MRLFIGFDGVSILAADPLFISAAEIYGERVISVVLSLRSSADRLEAEIVPAHRLAKGGVLGRSCSYPSTKRSFLAAQIAPA